MTAALGTARGSPARALCALLAGLACACGAARAETSPPIAGLASLLVPGLGQASNGDYGAAAAHFGVYAFSAYHLVRAEDQPGFLDDLTRYRTVNDGELTNRTMLRYDYAARLASGTSLYSAYGAYRDARLREGNRGYRTPAPRESLDELALAPFNPAYLVRPTTWIPLALQAWAVSRSRGGYGIYRSADVSAHDLHTFNVLANEATAVGEEAFFRGVLNNGFSSSFGEGWGLTLSSLTFGLAHNGQGQTANIVQASLAGAYLGWMHQRNGYQAAEGVALHYWINVLAGISAIRNGGTTPLLTLRTAF